MFVYQISKLEVSGMLREHSRKHIGDKLILFPPKFLVKFNFLRGKRSFQYSVVLKLRFQIFCVWYVSKIQRFTKLIKNLSKNVKNLVGRGRLSAFGVSASQSKSHEGDIKRGSLAKKMKDCWKLNKCTVASNFFLNTVKTRIICPIAKNYVCKLLTHILICY